DARPTGLTVLAFALADDTDRVLRERDELGVRFPVLSGLGLRLTYAVDATPKFVVLDAAGVVRGAYIGWGRELPGLVAQELDRCQNATEATGKSGAHGSR